jgi:uncharacterized membrane protein YeiH
MRVIGMYLPSFPNLDLFSAGVNAPNGVLVARNPSHNRGYTAAGLLIMALFDGIGGGVSHDLLLNDIPSPIKDPSYILVCLVAGWLGLAIYRYAESKEEHFRKRILAFFKSFTLPWFAILGAHKALDQGLGFFSAILVGLLAITAGGVLIDVFSAVTPEVVSPSEHAVTTVVLAGGVYAGIALLGKQNAHFFRHPGRGTGFISLPRVCGAGSLAADRAHELPTGRTRGRATGRKAGAFVVELKELAVPAAAISRLLPRESQSCM